jgi:hypothetical protein
VAGASTAMLMTRRGLRVLAVDRAHFPSDTVAFYRRGDRSHLAGHFAGDLRFAFADRVERRGLDLYASALASELVPASAVGRRSLPALPAAPRVLLPWHDRGHDEARTHARRRDTGMVVG